MRPTDVTPDPVQSLISLHLRKFWEDVFHWQEGLTEPTFEDHFTTLDLAANSGHNLGPNYPPNKLRAIRRLSIHRVFDILNRFIPNEKLGGFLDLLARGRNNALISMNWDIVVENHLIRNHQNYNYGISMQSIDHEYISRNQELPLLKLQGSSNWLYCDSCRKLYCGPPGGGKTALRSWTFLEEKDFKLLDPNVTHHIIQAIINKKESSQFSKCIFCNNPLTARVATFSYSKAYNYFQFQGVWARALEYLLNSRNWIFIGYSLPDADYEVRHLLKTAQMANPNKRKLRITVVSRCSEDALDRYARFFGISKNKMHNHGFSAWFQQEHNRLLN